MFQVCKKLFDIFGGGLGVINVDFEKLCHLKGKAKETGRGSRKTQWIHKKKITRSIVRISVSTCRQRAQLRAGYASSTPPTPGITLHFAD